MGDSMGRGWIKMDRVWIQIQRVVFQELMLVAL